MEYSEVLKRNVLERRHHFVYGNAEERTPYFQKIAKQEYIEDGFFGTDGKYIVPLYLDYRGFQGDYHQECETWRLNAIQSDYFEFLLTQMMFERLKGCFPDEIEIVEKNLTYLFFNKDINSLDLLNQELIGGLQVYQEFYEHYQQTGELKFDLLQEMKITCVIFESLFRKLKELLPHFHSFIVLLDKKSDFSSIYTRVLNTYIASRSHNYLSFKIGTLGRQDWDNYETINGEYIERTHDYGIIEMKDYVLDRKRKV